MGQNFLCKKCKYAWKSRKRNGRPANCPRCNSKKIIFNTLVNSEVGLMIGITGIVIFFFTLGATDGTTILIRNLAGVIGIPVLIGTILMIVGESGKNKRILKNL